MGRHAAASASAALVFSELTLRFPAIRRYAPASGMTMCCEIIAFIAFAAASQRTAQARQHEVCPPRHNVERWEENGYAATNDPALGGGGSGPVRRRAGREATSVETRRGEPMRRGPCQGPAAARSGTPSLAKPTGVGGAWLDPPMSSTAIGEVGWPAAVSVWVAGMSGMSGIAACWSSAIAAALRNMECGPATSEHSTGILSRPTTTNRTTSDEALPIADLPKGQCVLLARAMLGLCLQGGATGSLLGVASGASSPCPAGIRRWRR